MKISVCVCVWVRKCLVNNGIDIVYNVGRCGMFIILAMYVWLEAKMSYIYVGYYEHILTPSLSYSIRYRIYVCS